MLMVFSCGIAFAQDEAAAGNDSTALPVIEYGSMPRKYEIADISISGADNYEDFVLIGYSGLAVGDVIVVKAGERVPIDGVVVEGASQLDTAALTVACVTAEALCEDALCVACL